jgi:hypothetical protein
MDLGDVEKRIREAEFFLERMRDVETRVAPVGEQFDFYLSAFLGAGRAVDAKLTAEHGDAYGPWRRKWNWTNGPADDLMRFFSEDQPVASSASGAKRDEALARAKEEGGSTTTVTGPPGAFALGGGSKHDYFFKIDGVAHKATDACAEYVKVLKRMVGEFKAAHS